MAAARLTASLRAALKVLQQHPGCINASCDAQLCQRYSALDAAWDDIASSGAPWDSAPAVAAAAVLLQDLGQRDANEYAAAWLDAVIFDLRSFACIWQQQGVSGDLAPCEGLLQFVAAGACYL